MTLKLFLMETARVMHLLPLMEQLRFQRALVRYSALNRDFIKDHPDFQLPPLQCAYDAFGAIDWNYYFSTGCEVAAKIASIIRSSLGQQRIKVLEWGCGPACNIRHMPGQLPQAELFGSDYNRETIAWCASAIQGVTFSKNNLEPPLPFESGMFDCVYSLSVLTHLSEANCIAWVKELVRVLRPGGTLIFTTKGDFSAKRLFGRELRKYKSGIPVVRGNAREGKRIYDTVHPPEYVKKVLLEGLEPVEFTPVGMTQYGQDLWVARKPG
jgi:SAM-dependent methyltransferase